MSRLRRWFSNYSSPLNLVEQSLIWIVGSPRAGTTWLAGMLGAHRDVLFIDEPLIGLHIGVLFDQIISLPSSSGDAVGRRVRDLSSSRDDYFFSDRYRGAWQPALRRLILERFRAQLLDDGRRARKTRLVVKEPHGSEG